MAGERKGSFFFEDTPAPGNRSSGGRVGPVAQRIRAAKCSRPLTDNATNIYMTVCFERLISFGLKQPLILLLSH